MAAKSKKSPARKKSASPRKRSASTPRGMADEVARIIDDHKGIDIEILDVSKKSPITSFLVICTGTSVVHLRTIAQAVRDHYKKKGRATPAWSGSVQSNWLILDLGGVIVHAMGHEARAFYGLETLWGRSGITYHL